MGDPIEQSLSPVVHNAGFRELGLNKVMVPFLVPTAELPAFFKELLWLDIKGCSVTIPHKEAIVPLLQQKEGCRRADREAATRWFSRRTAACRLQHRLPCRDGFARGGDGRGSEAAKSPAARFWTSRC